jgi:gliding motility-associated-like protein
MSIDTNPPQQNQFTLVFPQAGTFKLSVLYQSIGADDITITVDPNIEPEFEVYTCAGLQTSIKITDKNYDQYQIDFNNDGVNENVIPNSNNQTATHNYGAAGNYNISVKGKNLNSANNCNAEINAFTALTTLPVPQINTLTVQTSTDLEVAFTPQTNIQYKLEIAVNNSNTFQQFQTLYDKDIVTASNLKAEDNYYCFRLGSYDPCNNTNTYSFPVCSQNFDLSIQSGLNQLAWITSPTGVINSQIERDASVYTTIPGSPSSFSDTDIKCKTNYCYKVVNVYANGVKSYSLEKCGEAFTTTSPTAIENVSSEVMDNGVTLEWIQDPLFNSSQYEIFKNQNGGSFTIIDATTLQTYDDPNYTTESNTCYKINYTDLCDNASQPGSMVCPIKLSYTIDKKNAITLKWSKLKGYKNGVNNYQVQKFDRSGGLMSTTNVGTDTLYIDNQKDLINQIVHYKVLANANDSGISTSISNQVDVTKGANLFYPTAFTPDGTGPAQNETFSVSGQYIEKMELKIFDRWGSLVFYTDSNEAWDGTRNGTTMPEGTYVWIASITDLAGQNFSEHGTVVILRKGK